MKFRYFYLALLIFAILISCSPKMIDSHNSNFIVKFGYPDQDGKMREYPCYIMGKFKISITPPAKFGMDPDKNYIYFMLEKEIEYALKVEKGVLTVATGRGIYYGDEELFINPVKIGTAEDECGQTTESGFPTDTSKTRIKKGGQSIPE